MQGWVKLHTSSGKPLLERVRDDDDDDDDDGTVPTSTTSGPHPGDGNPARSQLPEAAASGGGGGGGRVAHWGGLEAEASGGSFRGLQSKQSFAC
jgi:hypothetical protein